MKKHFALLGGTTTFRECMKAIRYLVFPFGLVNGANIRKYEKKFSEFINCRYIHCFSSGRVGLYGIMKCLDIKEDDEVILQVPTHIVVSNAIKYLGAKPIYVDCSMDHYNIDLDKIKEKLSPRSKMLILQHTFGNPADIEEVIKFTKKNDLILIEDCVHSLGSKYKDKMLGSFGKASFFSTEETKIISSTMGGVVATNDYELSSRLIQFSATCKKPGFIITYGYVLKLLLYHIMMHPYIHGFLRKIYEIIGERNPLPVPVSDEELSGKLPKNYLTLFSNAQADIIMSQLDRLENINRHRKKISKIYHDIFSQKNIRTVEPNNNASVAFVRYPVWVANRRKAISALRPYAVLGTWFSSVLEEANHPKYGGYIKDSCPNAELVSEHLVNLPTHMRVSENDARNLATTLASIANSI